MENEIVVIEDFIKKEQQDHIEKLLLHSRSLPVYYQPGTTPRPEFINDKVIDTPQFVHQFVSFNKAVSPFWIDVKPIYNKLCELFNEQMFIVRCKMNFNYPHRNYNKDSFHNPHVDSPYKEVLACIYYVNDSDGDTVFFNEKDEVCKAVTPKKGSICYFNSNIVHTGQPPFETKMRSIINFNITRNKNIDLVLKAREADEKNVY